ncbi:MAG: YdcF family protein [Clostridia bacterium]|nr:YdcF family protein [Clostridia bacterium]
MEKILLILTALAVCIPICASFAVFLLSKRPRKPVQTDVIIVLGAKILPDGTPSNTLQYRLDAAKKAFDQNRAAAIIATGGQGRDENEAEAIAMKRYLIRKGVPHSRIFEETASKNTIENLRNAKRIMDENGFKTALIATTDYHMDRAMLIARRLSIPAGAVCARPGRRFSTQILAYAREAASWCFLILKIFTGKI